LKFSFVADKEFIILPPEIAIFEMKFELLSKSKLMNELIHSKKINLAGSKMWLNLLFTVAEIPTESRSITFNTNT